MKLFSFLFFKNLSFSYEGFKFVNELEYMTLES